MSDHHPDWEAALDDIDWDELLEDVDEQLLDNLAAELRFPSFDALNRASLSLGSGYQLIHLSDGRWAFWNEKTYVQEDVKFFHSPQHFIHFVIENFSFDEEQLRTLVELIEQSRQMKRCVFCGCEFDPEDSVRKELGIDGIYLDEDAAHMEFCSPQCAVEAVVQEMKE